MQDGPEVGLIATFDSCPELPQPIRAQQKPALHEYLKKADQGTKSRSETTAENGMNNGINQESQWQIKPTERPIRRREEPSEHPEHAKSTIQISIKQP
ncbi:hypothetical protein [Flavitalea sp.]|nr:hypothetical protein [Flavitalea sp.]